MSELRKHMDCEPTDCLVGDPSPCRLFQPGAALALSLGTLTGLHENLGDPAIVAQTPNVEEARIRLEDAWMRLHYELSTIERGSQTFEEG